VNQVEPLQNGGVLVAGSFSQFGNTSLPRVGRFTERGSLSWSFQPVEQSRSLDYIVTRVEVDKFWRMTVIGRGGNNNGYLVRLLADGRKDTTFPSLPTKSGGWYNEILPLAGGKLLVGGGFDSIAGVPCGNVALLDSNGQPVTSFLANFPGPTSNITGFALDRFGRILIAGEFSQIGGRVQNTIVRIFDDGRIDTSFHPLATPIGYGIRRICMVDDDIYLMGIFNGVDGYSIPRIARLVPSGPLALDTRISATKPTVSIYPNPAKSFANISIANFEGQQVARLMNAVGQVVGSWVVGQGSNEVSLQGYAAGMYQLQVGNFSSSRLVIE
jgi:hypothetical protein